MVETLISTSNKNEYYTLIVTIIVHMKDYTTYTKNIKELVSY